MPDHPPTHEHTVREQAYYLWEQDGRPHGRETEYWERAKVAVAEKSQLDTLTKAPPKKAAAKAGAAPKTAAGKASAAPKKVAASAAKATPVKAAKPAGRTTAKEKPKKK